MWSIKLLRIFLLVTFSDFPTMGTVRCYHIILFQQYAEEEEIALIWCKSSTYHQRLKLTHNDSKTESCESKNSELSNDDTKWPDIDMPQLHDDDTSKIRDDAIPELPDHATSCHCIQM